MHTLPVAGAFAGVKARWPGLRRRRGGPLPRSYLSYRSYPSYRLSAL